MKILTFSDLHGNFKALSNLKNVCRKANLVLCAGDISTMEHYLSNLMEELNSFSKPVFMVHGNHEEEESIKELCRIHENITFLHKGAHHMEDYVFLGYGGGGFSTEDPEFTNGAGIFFKRESAGKKRIILITHQPPYNTKLDFIGGRHTGNKDFRKFIDEVQPHLVVCGHLHENAGKAEKLGRTLIVNPGYKGVIVDI